MTSRQNGTLPAVVGSSAVATSEPMMNSGMARNETDHN